MTASVHGLSWFPNFPDKFLTYGQEIHLYKLANGGEDISKCRLPNIPANLLTSERRYQYPRCVQPSFHKNKMICAVGMGDGKIGICNFFDPNEISCLEFTPRQQRMCVCLAWNELEPNLLAIGHDRHRSDSCLTVWDIERGMPKDTDLFGISETAHSICWDRNHRVLIAGMSQKHIKLFDLRQSTATCQSIQTKMVHGLSVAPNGNYLCSYLDSVIMLWDLRAIDRPLKNIQSSKNHLQLSWCTTRTSVLFSLQRESPYVTLYDIRGVDVENSREVYHVKKQLLPFASKQHLNTKGFGLTALSWHPTDFERALLLTESGNISNFRLPLYILPVYSKQKKLQLLLQRPPSAPCTPSHSVSSPSSSLDSSLLRPALNFDVFETEFKDEVDIIRERAVNDYGLKSDFKRPGGLKLSSYLRNVWLCLDNLNRDERLTGLKTTLGIGLGHTSEVFMASSRIESHVLQWPEFINNSNNLVCYRSEQRDLAIKLCGWSFEQDLERFVSALCENKEFSRAAMICVFYLKIISACDILSKAADTDPSTFRIAAIALSSFNADRCSSTWRNQRANANMQVQDAHLRAIFSFLITENDNFDAVLTEEGISLADRVAFACKYLSESKLAEYVKQQIQKSIEKGDLNGLLLTGESNDGINILQAYLDSTFDVQTVALIAINYFYKDNSNDNRIQYWISSYLDYLNSWGLWEKRAELEIKMENLKPNSSKSCRSVYLSCHFCGKSVSNALQEDVRIRTASSNINKLSSCPNCRKPLPRCALCLLHMGTILNTSSADDAGPESLGWQSKPFSKWFSWCQTCRHGGHTEHLLEWFKQNSECPVPSCSCRCFDLDVTEPNHARDFT